MYWYGRSSTFHLLLRSCLLLVLLLLVLLR